MKKKISKTKSAKVPTSFEHLAELWDSKTLDAGNQSDNGNLAAIQKFLGNVKGKCIYEIACGNGYLSRKIMRAGAKEVYASDASPTLVGFATDKYDRMGINYSVREGTDFTKIPKGHFDAVVIHQGIFYLKDIPKLMKGVRSILKPNGILMFTLTHPLFPVFMAEIGQLPTEGPDSLVPRSRKYPTNYTKQVNKKWITNGKPTSVRYIQYSRPLEYYINQCVDAGLLIGGIKETPSKTRGKNLKIVTSPIPSSYVIKAVKI